ncbi:O-antigen ligase family protein [Bradyrhizobium sp. STM 3561]|uniref:O-antigen ligase family protein n=1 Tax=Bradyrhizobium sp. STM 3561 TaxID=578923 RepID=UPI00388F9C03
MQFTHVDDAATRFEARLSLVAGAVDGLVFLSYLFQIDQSTYYAATILFKLCLLFLRGRQVTEAARTSVPFLYVLLLAEVTSAAINEVEFISTIRIIVFCINLFVSLNFVSTNYWRGLFLSTLANAATYLALVETGNIAVVFGRYLYFSQSHPNLGAEIFFGGAFAALLVKAPRLSLLALPLFFIPAFLMQGRAAELGILFIGGMLVSQLLSRVGQFTRLALVIFVCIGLLLIILNSDVSGWVAKLLLLDDAYRGEGTGASGRGQYWANAIETWLNNPVFGAGSDYYIRLGTTEPHSFFLYPLAFYGFMGIVALSAFMQRFLAVMLYGHSIYLLPFAPMLAFNDRFVNLNVYPTILFLYVFYQYSRAKKPERLLTPVKQLDRLSSPTSTHYL